MQQQAALRFYKSSWQIYAEKGYDLKIIFMDYFYGFMI